MNREEIIRLVRSILSEERNRVISQSSIFPDTIKQRHVGEGVRFIRAGLAASRPTSGEKAGAIYFATDTNVLSIWNGTAWTTHTIT